MSVTDAGYLSVLFDVGEIIGGILAGFMSDQLDARATTASRAGARVDDIYSHDPSVVLVTWHLGYDCDLCNGCRVEGAAVPVQQGLDPLPQ
uniref:Major facilitator superfamily (MFS) profile domain-containing protein n=1 Tax=Aegilops tauschii subsp. strangulata TaxID=200361 RepID=A0A453IDT1_AEGTS